jgi:hypothetical protein
MSVTISLRSMVAFATGLAVALIAVIVFQAWRVDAAPGDSDTTFVPITPCRLIDTRPAPLRVGPTAAFGADDTKTIAARGSNGDCTIPAIAIGLSLNVTAVGASQATFLTLWPGGTKPTASSLNPTPGEPPTPNAVTTRLSSAGAFNVFNRFGTVEVIIDINGYYTKQSLQAISSRLTALEGANTGARLTELETTTARLFAARPFVNTAHDANEDVGLADEVVVSVLVAAPVIGQVTVNSTTLAIHTASSSGVRCSITTGNVLDLNFNQGWNPAGGSGIVSQMAGTRSFDIAAGATITYNLVCRVVGSGTANLSSTVLTAIFTPAP